jgi:LacI family repressor for deo operon, udp, cdd, tsx, nupC, and nupG
VTRRDSRSSVSPAKRSARSPRAQARARVGIPVTIEDVAEAAGVSTATVSRVLNQSALVKSETRARVEDAISHLSYRPSDIARSMARGRTATIGLVLDDLTNPFNSQAAEVVMHTAEKSGFRTILGLAPSQSGRCAQVSEFLLRQRVDGFLFGQARLEEPAIEALLDKGLPVVLFNRRLRQGNASYVGCDNYRGSAAVADHLIRLGHESLAIIAGPANLSTVAERIAGFQAALRAARMRAAPVFYTRYRTGDAYSAMTEVLKRDRKPTAVFATTDFMALEAIQYAVDHQLKVPGDLAVVGFDDIVLAAHPWIRLTTVAQHIAKQASRAVEHLLGRIGGKQQQPVVELLPVELVIRRTCGGGQ